MSALPSFDCEASASPVLNEVTLTAVGNALRERGLRPRDVRPEWLRVKLVFATGDDRWSALTDDECFALLHRAADLVDVEFDEQDLAAQMLPAPREADESSRPRARPLPGFTISAVWNGYNAPSYLVKRILAPAELTVLFGESGHFKSVIAIDLALCVATGSDFHGMRTRRAGVLYVAGEGHSGIRKRARAWLLERGFDAASDQPSLYVTSDGADLIGQPDQLRATVEAAEAALGAPVEFVVVDTLAANFGQGDENHASDMQLAIAGARRAAPAAAVLLVHHVGQGQSHRERGSYALVAAADVRLQASYDELSKVIELQWLKLKDDERPRPLLFAWKQVALDCQDGDGEELSSVVLQPFDGPAPAPQAPRSVGLGANQEKALKVLRTLLAKARKNLAERGDDAAKACILTNGWRHELEEKYGFKRFAYRDTREGLEKRGLIRFEGPHVYPVESIASEDKA